MRQLQLAIRNLRRTPAFTVAAALTLALGIGLATAVFTVAHTLLVRELPVRDQDRLVVLWGRTPDGRFDHYPVSLGAGRELLQSSRTLAGAAFVAYEGAWPTPIVEGDRLTRLRRALVSGEFFEVLGARPLLGRTLTPEDDRTGAAPVLVLSYGAWQRHFGGDPQVLGRSIVLHETGVAHTIVGVMPPGLDYPRQTDMWAALVPVRGEFGPNAALATVDVVGRLTTGATPEHARGELEAFFERADSPVWQRDLQGAAHTLPTLVLGDTRPAVIAFAAAAALLLVITCVNVATLLVARGMARRREIAVRTALGATRRRLMAHLLTESAVLAVAGGALGIFVAWASVRGFVAIAPAGTPRLDEIAIDGTAVLGAIGVTTLAMLLFALAPAMTSSQMAPHDVLRADPRQSASRRSRLTTEALVALQMALALVVLSAAALVTTSLVRLERADLSFEPTRLLVAELSLRADQYESTASQVAMLDALVERIVTLPGVEGASPVVAAPFAGSGGWDGRPASDGQSRQEAAVNPMLNMEVVGPDYFATMGIPVLLGRAFTAQDREGQPAVVVISESAARYYWPGENPIGQRLRMGGNLEQAMTVVGIVPETRYRDLRTPRSSIYFPLHQSFFPFAPNTLVIRTTVSPETIVPALRNLVRETASGVDVANAAPFARHLDGPLSQPRLNAMLLAMFAAAAAVLAAIGLFGVMATMVRQRTRELGVRMALGATARDLRSMLLRRGLLIATAGTAMGLAGALAANQLLAAMLYEVSPTDPGTLAAVAAVLLGVAIVASLLPARAIGRIDPVVVLRAEG